MLNTPFGEISVKLNGENISYNCEKLENTYAGQHGLSVFEVDGRYRITVGTAGIKAPFTLDCGFDLHEFDSGGIDSGERLALKTWEKGNLMFSIGTEDEIEGLNYEYLERGIRLHGCKDGAAVFGIAWVYIKDYEKESNYTWFAADPTYAM